MKISGAVTTECLPARAGASRLADRIPGQQVKAVLANADNSLRVEWRAMLTTSYYDHELIEVDTANTRLDMAAGKPTIPILFES